MTTTIKTTQGDFKVTSTFKGNKLWPADEKKQNYNNHVITVSHNGSSTRFEFWGSIMNPEIGSVSDLQHAFYCFLSDAVSAKQSFEDFCSEFGYDSDSRKAERIYKACEKSLAKLEKLYSGDCYDLINEVQELTNA